jgi:hypothetical protein
MAWFAALFVVILLGSLAALFTAAALAIRHDFTERFDRIGARLREDAEALVNNLPKDP